jgi:hypothetical protein
VAYTVASFTVYNVALTGAALVEMWITSEDVPQAADKVLRVTIPSDGTVILENALLKPQEKVFVRSSLPLTEYFAVGMTTLT